MAGGGIAARQVVVVRIPTRVQAAGIWA